MTHRSITDETVPRSSVNASNPTFEITQSLTFVDRARAIAKPTRALFVIEQETI
jgi:hypothetical protein